MLLPSSFFVCGLLSLSVLRERSVSSTGTLGFWVSGLGAWGLGVLGA